MKNVEYITSKQWDSYARRIEKRNLRETGRSLSFTGIARRAHSFIVEVRLDTDTMIVKAGWRDAMKQDGDA